MVARGGAGRIQGSAWTGERGQSVWGTERGSVVRLRWGREGGFGSEPECVGNEVVSECQRTGRVESEAGGERWLWIWSGHAFRRRGQMGSGTGGARRFRILVTGRRSAGVEYGQRDGNGTPGPLAGG